MNAFHDDILRDQVAIVTGGATGIGREIARTLGHHGARICICNRKVGRLENSAAELEAEGIDCVWHQCDVREPDQVGSTLPPDDPGQDRALPPLDEEQDDCPRTSDDIQSGERRSRCPQRRSLVAAPRASH